MIPDEFFKNTPIGQPVRYRHPGCTDPSKDKALVVTRMNTGWKWFCHRCQKGGIKPLDSLSPSKLVSFQKDMKVAEFQNVDEISLPKDFTSEIPAAGLAWLYQYGITNEEIEQYGIGFSPSQNRVILPTYEYGELVFFIGRLLGEPTKHIPKYASVAVSRKEIYFKAEYKGSIIVVIVEDILSAIKIGRQATALALISTFIPDELMIQLFREYKRMVIWLDPNKFPEMIESTLRYQMMGMNVVFVDSKKDPKYYSDSEIETYLFD